MTDNLMEEQGIKFLDSSRKVNIHLYNGEVESIKLPGIDDQMFNDIFSNGKSQNAYVFHDYEKDTTTTLCIPCSQLAYIDYDTIKPDTYDFKEGFEENSELDISTEVEVNIHLSNDEVKSVALSEFNDQMLNNILSNNKSRNVYTFYGKDTTVWVPCSQLAYIDYKTTTPVQDVAEPEDPFEGGITFSDSKDDSPAPNSNPNPFEGKEDDLDDSDDFLMPDDDEDEWLPTNPDPNESPLIPGMYEDLDDDDDNDDD